MNGLHKAAAQEKLETHGSTVNVRGFQLPGDEWTEVPQGEQERSYYDFERAWQSAPVGTTFAANGVNLTKSASGIPVQSCTTAPPSEEQLIYGDVGAPLGKSANRGRQQASFGDSLLGLYHLSGGGDEI